MKTSLLASALALFLSSPAFAQQQGEPVKPIPATEAKKFVGKEAVVVGKVAEVNKTDKVMRLNFEHKYPKQVFTGVVFARDFGAFTNLERLEGKTVELSGKVEEYRGRPEVVLRLKGQLRVLEEDKAPPAAK